MTTYDASLEALMLDPISLATLTSAVTLVAQDYGKGVAGEAGKATWIAIKSLFGWRSDPAVAEVPEQVATGLSSSPEIAEKLIEILKRDPSQPTASLVHNLTVVDGKVVIAQHIQNLTM
jgi:hypothetical protein